MKTKTIYSQAELMEVGLQKVRSMERDVQLLASANLTMERITGLNNLVLQVSNFKSDDEMLVRQITATADKDKASSDLVNQLRYLSVMLQRDLEQFKSAITVLGLNRLSSLAPAELTRTAQKAIRWFGQILPELETVGYTAQNFTLLQNAANAYAETEMLQDKAVNNRFLATIERNRLMQKLQNELVYYCKLARLVLQNYPELRKDYIMYESTDDPESPPEAFPENIGSGNNIQATALGYIQ